MSAEFAECDEEDCGENKFHVRDPVHVVMVDKKGLFYAGVIKEIKYLMRAGRGLYIYKVQPELDGCKFECWVEENNLRLSLV